MVVLTGLTEVERNLSRLDESSEGLAAVIEGVESNVATGLLRNGWARPAGVERVFLLLPSRP